MTRVSKRFFQTFRMMGVCATVLALQGCDSAKKMMGLSVEAPDAFAVMKHPPLEVPPQFTLVPPQLGKKGPQHMDASKKAAASVSKALSPQQENAARALATATPETSSAQHPLLHHIQKAPENVRQQLHEDRAEERQGPTFLQQLARQHNRGDVIDPKKELETVSHLQ